MNIIYNIEIIPEATECFDYSTNTPKMDSNIVVKEGKEYLSFSGNYYIGDRLSPVVSYLTKGAALYPKVAGPDVALKAISSDTLIEANKVIDLIGINVDSTQFKKLQQYVKKAKRVGVNTYEIQDVLLSNADAIFFSIDSGTVSIVPVATFTDANIVTATGYDSSLFYFLLGNSFKVDAKDSYVISKQDVKHIPFGFCNFEYKKPSKTSIELLGDMILLRSEKSSTLSASFPIKFDGAISKQYSVRGHESVILEPSDNTAPLTDITINLADPSILTMIYYIEDDTTLTPALLVVGSHFSSNFSNLSPINLDTILSYNTETLQRYVYKTYKVDVSENGVLIGSIYNKDFYNNIIQNKALYTNIVTMV